MESQPQNSEFRNNPENFHPCRSECICRWEMKTHGPVQDILVLIASASSLAKARNA